MRRPSKRRSETARARTRARAKTEAARPREPRQHAKLFWTGRSQAVRLPKEFRFDGDAVLIRREGNDVILSPVGDGWPEGWWDWLVSAPHLPDDFVLPDDPPPEDKDLF